MTVALDLEPYGSRVLVFSTEPARHQEAAPEGAPLDLSVGWTVRYGAKTVRMDSLRSWTEDEDMRYYSGEAVYERDVQVPQDLIERAAEVRLDFGEGCHIPETRTRNGMRTWLDAPVRDAAVVYVNGERAGSVWCPPYALDVKKFLRPGANRLRIVVGNTAINHMAGRRLPDYRLLNARYGVRFEPQDMENLQPLPSGLLGPIRLIPISDGSASGTPPPPRGR